MENSADLNAKNGGNTALVIVELNSHPELIMRLHKERVQCSNIANELMEVNRYKIKAILDRFMLRHTM